MVLSTVAGGTAATLSSSLIGGFAKTAVSAFVGNALQYIDGGAAVQSDLQTISSQLSAIDTDLKNIASSEAKITSLLEQSILLTMTNQVPTGPIDEYWTDFEDYTSPTAQSTYGTYLTSDISSLATKIELLAGVDNNFETLFLGSNPGVPTSTTLMSVVSQVYQTKTDASGNAYNPTPGFLTSDYTTAVLDTFNHFADEQAKWDILKANADIVTSTGLNAAGVPIQELNAVPQNATITTSSGSETVWAADVNTAPTVAIPAGYAVNPSTNQIWTTGAAAGFASDGTANATISGTNSSLTATLNAFNGQTWTAVTKSTGFGIKTNYIPGIINGPWASGTSVQYVTNPTFGLAAEQTLSFGTPGTGSFEQISVGDWSVPTVSQAQTLSAAASVFRVTGPVWTTGTSSAITGFMPVSGPHGSHSKPIWTFYWDLVDPATGVESTVDQKNTSASEGLLFVAPISTSNKLYV